MKKDLSQKNLKKKTKDRKVDLWSSSMLRRWNCHLLPFRMVKLFLVRCLAAGCDTFYGATVCTVGLEFHWAIDANNFDRAFRMLVDQRNIQSFAEVLRHFYGVFHGIGDQRFDRLFCSACVHHLFAKARAAEEIAGEQSKCSGQKECASYEHHKRRENETKNPPSLTADASSPYENRLRFIADGLRCFRKAGNFSPPFFSQQKSKLFTLISAL